MQQKYLLFSWLNCKFIVENDHCSSIVTITKETSRYVKAATQEEVREQENPCWARSLADTAMTSKFSITVSELKELMENRSTDGKKRIDEKYGGIDKIVQLLQSDATKGLDAKNTADLAARVEIFGTNFIPPKPPKQHAETRGTTN